MVTKVRFKRASKFYDFDPNGLELHTGMRVVTETARGIELGECMTGVMEVADERVTVPLKPIIRIATDADLMTQTRNEQLEKEAFDIAVERIAEHKLEMKLVDVEYAFDHSKIIFYFTANGRVDFRMLVKNLAGIFKTRIELRQIGVRDEAKMLGGIGPCGRSICCRSFLGDFTPVSIKMAKEQSLSLNPTKISGLCDRLMCCLKYEQDHYEATRKRMPRVGREIITPDGVGTINAINVLDESVRVRIAVGDDFELRTYPIDDCHRPDQNRSEPHHAEPSPAEQEPAEPETPDAAQSVADAADSMEEDFLAAMTESPELDLLDALPETDIPAPQPVEQAPRTEKPDNPPRGERPDRADRPPRGERPPRADKPPRGERPPRADKPPRGERPPRAGKPDKAEHGDKPDRPERPPRAPRSERPPRAERPDRPPRADRPPRGEKPDRQLRGDKPPRSPKPADADKPATTNSPKSEPVDAEMLNLEFRSDNVLEDLL